MKTNQQGIDLIKKYESCKLVAYRALPTEKYFTIGWGHYGSDVKAGMVISQAKADAMFLEDLKRYEKYVDDLSFNLNSNQFSALVSFTYNCGAGNLKKLVANRTLADIPDAMLKYNHAGGMEHAGLTKRRKEERALFLTPVNDKKVKTMIKIGHASKTETGGIKNGTAGDQTGSEVCIRTWYNRPWTCVIRFHDPSMREKAAQCMEWACANNHIGYDQNQRNTLLNAVRKLGYDPRQATTNVETDCSALVTLCCIYAGIAEGALVIGENSATTRNLKQRLKSTGEVTIFTSKDYTADTDKLLRGDILLNEGHHTAIVVSGNLVDNSDRSLEDVAMAVIRGEYGNGSVRRAKLTEEGWNYALVQAKVSELLKRHV